MSTYINIVCPNSEEGFELLSRLEVADSAQVNLPQLQSEIILRDRDDVPSLWEVVRIVNEAAGEDCFLIVLPSIEENEFGDQISDPVKEIDKLYASTGQKFSRR